MKTFMRESISALLLGAVVMTSAPEAASAETSTEPSPEWTAPYDAVLYELNENLSLRALQGGRRKATSQLMGFARKGSPLCPPALAYGKPYCTINATGSDNISLTTGLGKFGGLLWVVGDGDNAVDSPEAVLARGRFSGHMDFGMAILKNVPLGSVRGEMALNGGPKQPFTGNFRLPFVVPIQDPTCVATSGRDKCAVYGHTKPMYLMDPATFGVEYVDLESEQAIGFPTVRFEIKFD